MDKERIIGQKLLPEQVCLYYLGQVGMLMQYRGKFILIDGYLSDYVDRHCCRGDLVWVRNYPAPIRPEELDFVDYVFCTHGHFDHADPDTLRAIAKVNKKARFFVPAPIRDDVAAYGIPAERMEGMHPDVQVTLDAEIEVTAIPAAHEELHPDAQGDYPEMGYIFRLGALKLYHAGDCCPYDGLEARLAGCNVLMMPINGRDYMRRYEQDVIGNFDSVEVITLAKRVNADLLIPLHFDLYDINGVNPAYFVDCLRRINAAQRFHIFAPGEKYIVDQG